MTMPPAGKPGAWGNRVNISSLGDLKMLATKWEQFTGLQARPGTL